MLSELFRIPVEAGGVPILGLGVLLALWVVGFGAAMAWHASRHGFDAEFWAFAQPLVVGAVVLFFAPRFAPQGVPIRGYGVMLLAAISVGLAMAVHRARRHGVAPDTIFALAFWLFIAGIAGARAFFVIEYWEERYAGRPLGETIVDVLQFTEGGLVVYGSVIGGLVAFVWFMRRNKLPLFGMADIIAPCFMAGLAIGRIGCLLNGCCYGGQCDLPWAVTFPVESPPFMDQLVHGELHGVRLVENDGVQLVEGDTSKEVTSINGEPIASLEDTAQVLGEAYAGSRPVELKLADGAVVERPAAVRTRSLPIHPTQLYSTIDAGLTAWLLWAWFPYRRRDGEVALLMFTIYPVTRFLTEAIRTDEPAIFGTGLSISQNVSIIVLTLAVVGWVWLLRTPPGRRLREVPEDSSGGRTASATAA
jgi:phosphatidylglycerol:prolipoprotein diacylglycerol transferase